MSTFSAAAIPIHILQATIKQKGLNGD